MAEHCCWNGSLTQKPTTVSILGATGSIGSSAAGVILANAGRFTVQSVVGGSNASALAQRAILLKARSATIADPKGYAELKTALAGTDIAVSAGADAVCDAARMPADRIVAAITGIAGLLPTCAALEQGTVVALANKESMVSAGSAVMKIARQYGATILPLDSEHNSIFQALGGAPLSAVEKITLTASGGPFRTWSREQIANATLEQALRHPNFTMGAKITVDSATMMNKGLEIIEAAHLFGFSEREIDVLVHPQQVIHGLVHFKDGSLNAGMAAPTMTVPMAHCLAYPDRVESGAPRLDFASLGQLQFYAPDEERFPCLRLARDALSAGNAMPTILNAANEVVVEAFLKGHVKFGDIFTVVNSVMNSPGMAGFSEPESVNDAVSVDHEARMRTAGELSRLSRRGTTDSVEWGQVSA